MATTEDLEARVSVLEEQMKVLRQMLDGIRNGPESHEEDRRDRFMMHAGDIVWEGEEGHTVVGP
jgi:hypothetical protein